jgi:predicted transposase/invertase (TIGR01784 family)
LQYITLTNDLIFKLIFGQEETKDILQNFVHAVLENAGNPPIKVLELKNPVNLRQTDYLKETILDINAIDETGRQFDVEVQVSSDPVFPTRSLYYRVQQFTEQLKKDAKYKKLRLVVCINILDFRLFDDLPDGHNSFMMQHTKVRDVVLTENLSLHFIELAKPVQSTEHFQWWIEYIRAEEGNQDMQILLSRDVIFRKAHEVFGRCTQDEALREQALTREMFLRNKHSRLSAARREGKLEGKTKGMREAATRLKALGVPMETIMQAT